MGATKENARKDPQTMGPGAAPAVQGESVL